MYIDNITSDGIALSNNGKEMLIKVYEQEIERLKDDNKYLNKVNIELSSEKNRLKSIIKEVRELRKKLSYQYYEMGFEVDIPMMLKYLDEILDKENI